jgi:hypothetical protein
MPQPVMRTPAPRNKRFDDLTGQKFGKLTVLSFAGFHGKYSCWNMRCDCGNELVKYGSQTKNRAKRYPNLSCGCETRHGLSTTKVYGRWRSMRSENLCDRWKDDVVAFAADTGEPPFRHAMLVAIDESQPIGPGNFRWEQYGKYYTIDGVRKNITEWLKVLGISRQALYYRLRGGRMTMEESLRIPRLDSSPVDNPYFRHYMDPIMDRRRKKKLIAEVDRLRYRGKALTWDGPKPKRFTVHEKREIRQEIAELIRKGATVYIACLRYGVTDQVVYRSIKEFKVKKPHRRRRGRQSKPVSK